MFTPDEIRTYENDANLAIATLWMCATEEDHNFSGGQPTDSVYSSYYSYAYGNAFTAICAWILADAQVTHGYGKNYRMMRGIPQVAEAIINLAQDWGPEPVRQLRKGVDIADIEELLKPIN